MDRRFEQVEQMKDTNDKYNAWMGFITSAIVTTNYTEAGWGLTRAPEHITRRLQQRLHRTLRPKSQRSVEPSGRGTRTEHYINVIGGEDDSRPIMVQDHAENAAVLEEMRPLFERWGGVDLEGSVAYGIRAYRNGSNLLMHVDKPTTHVVSGIYHVDRSEDAEPWPIVIEDFRGNTNQVYLSPGDILFYESSKCFHGRPQMFIGGYYASLFMHYRPADFPVNTMRDESHYAVPPHWHETSPPKEGIDEMIVVGTSFKEPNCKNLLCALDETHKQHDHLVNWHGPAPAGTIVTAGWDPESMTPPNDEDEVVQDNGGGKMNLRGAQAVLVGDNEADEEEL